MRVIIQKEDGTEVANFEYDRCRTQLFNEEREECVLDGITDAVEIEERCKDHADEAVWLDLKVWLGETLAQYGGETPAVDAHEEEQ